MQSSEVPGQGNEELKAQHWDVWQQDAPGLSREVVMNHREGVTPAQALHRVVLGWEKS